ncbi:unnamed protein product [Brugia pahangi]|uniref:Ovule protein n=1 Tax=Brugia pahangi TaxID=6280 RepID=A0A0N4TKA2_BRUPA|nr:unnamed protein product [Brugia pahangi]
MNPKVSASPPFQRLPVRFRNDVSVLSVVILRHFPLEFTALFSLIAQYRSVRVISSSESRCLQEYNVAYDILEPKKLTVLSHKNEVDFVY